MENEYKDIPGSEHYSISKEGKVFSKRNRKFLSPSLTNGYPSVEIWGGNKRKRVGVHILVALTYIGPRPELSEVMHLDGNRENSQFSNLRYGSRSCNSAFKLDHGTYFPPPNNCGKNRKLNMKQANRIREYLWAGITGGQLARDFGVSERAINLIKHKRTYK